MACNDAVSVTPCSSLRRGVRVRCGVRGGAQEITVIMPTTPSTMLYTLVYFIRKCPVMTPPCFDAAI